MKLSKILKNRKAMTPLMIGLIVAASVVAVLFIVMAAVIPVMKHELYMQVRANSVRANSTDSIQLRFNVLCDYTDGELWRVEIYQNNELYGFRNVDYELYRNNETTVYVTHFDTDNTQAPPSEVDAGRLVFQDDEQYTIRIYFRPIGSDRTDLYSETVFTFRALD